MQRSNKEIILCSLLAFVWAIQVAVILIELLGFCHPMTPISDALLPESLGRLAPKWDLLIYGVFVALSLMGANILFKYAIKPVNQWFLIFEGALSFLMVSALFKMLVNFNSPQLAQSFLWVLIAVAVLVKIFYPEVKRLSELAYQRLNSINLGPYANAWWVGIIALFIYMPDLERVIAMIFVGESLHHLDFFLMGSGWSFLCGQLPSVDVLGEYGIGLPVIFAKLINACGGFDYVHALGVMMWFVIMYFISMYFFVRYWLGSALIAGVAFLLVFRMQMFHFGVSPLIWCVPSASVVRFGFDILWMAALLFHLRSGRSHWLLLAGVYSGFAVYYMTSSGLCVMASFYLYLLAQALLPDLRQRWILDGSKKFCFFFSCFLPVIITLILLGSTIKEHLFQKEFWGNLLDYMITFSRAGAMPMFESLKYRHYWAFIMSMVMPFTYLITLLYIGIGLYFRKGPAERLFTAILCIYGLGHYQYYVVRSAITSYYVDALTFVLIVCFWFMRLLEYLPLLWQRRLKAGALVLSFYALLTNQNYLAYPNILSFSRNPITDNLLIQRFPDRTGYFNHLFKKTREEDKLPLNDLGVAEEDLRTEDDFKDDAALVAYYRSRFNFQEDVALIRQLTQREDRVALISSFETKILIDAKRAPFFYHFPLVSARPMTFRTFPGEGVNTKGFLRETLKQLAQNPPEYIFMEKVFLQDKLPNSYRENNGRILSIIEYVRARYQPFRMGKYLVVMKLKR